MSKVDKDQVIEEFTKAYQKAHGKTPVIEAKSGWYSVDGGKNIRIAQLEEMTAELQGAGSAKAEKKAAAPAKAEKPKKAAPAKKAKSKKASGFSVKAFYAEKLQANDPNATLPR
ncbi:hypothetical protein [Alteromonas sp. CYL-A6]|uniref:hypothetical protein n=1 Tax=Alteromonas nitratireducens TaxID=3390813 RepID=UPI0034AAB85E